MTDNDYDACSREAAEETLASGDWGEVNSLACDAYFQGQQDIMRGGPKHLGLDKRMTKEQALAWVEKVYG